MEDKPSVTDNDPPKKAEEGSASPRPITEESHPENSALLEFHEESVQDPLEVPPKDILLSAPTLTVKGDFRAIPEPATKEEVPAGPTNETEENFEPEGERGKLRYLKYGDKIRLKLAGCIKYYLNSDGFATERVYLQQGSGEKMSQVFRVMPKLDHNAFDSLRKDLKNLMKAKSKPASTVAGSANYMNDVISEVELNSKTYANLIGRPVHYHVPIQLIHEETLQYISASKNVELSDKEVTQNYTETELNMLVKAGIKKDIMRVYSLKLVPYSDATTHFVLIPCHKYQESGYILEEDSFYFAYADTKLLSKHFHLYFPLAESNPVSGKSYLAHLYDSIKTAMRFEGVPEKCPNHLCRALDRKIIWITHIESPLLLCLEKLEKSTEQDENELADLIEGSTGEAVSQAFALGFKKYDPEQPMTSNGLWVVVPKVDDKRKVTLKHLFYDVWLKPMIIENVVRGESQRGIIGNGSVIKLILHGRNEYINIKTSLFLSHDKSSASQGIITNTEDYARCFKVVQVRDDEQLKYTCLAQLSMFIRGYDEQTLLKTYDFTKQTAFNMLSKVLRSLKRLCRNTLVSVYNPMAPYGAPYEDIQMLFREAKCIDTFTYLLLKLFPAGASGDYKENPMEAKVLGQLLMLIAITVKNNTKNQVYTFNKAMSIVQKYIGLHLPKKQEDQALLSVVENCEEILQDLSLEQIINQFVRELAVNDFEEQMKKHEILDILRIFCIFRKKAITETQNLLYNTLFETEKGSKIFLPFKFKDETNEIILKIDGEEEISCTGEWERKELKKDVLLYFKNQLFLLSDICYKNPHILNSIKGMFPIPAVIKNLATDALEPTAKIGLAKILTSLFENTENLIFVTKPKLQQEWDKDCVCRGRVSKYMSAAELERVKEVIEAFFTQGLEVEDTALHCEYLKFLTYLIRCDFIFSQSDSAKEWEKNLQNSYKLLFQTFFFCCGYLESITNEQKHNATLRKLGEDGEPEEEPQVITVQTETKSMDCIKDSPLFLKYSTNYAHIFETLREAGKNLEKQTRSSGEDSVQKEICNFFCEINLLLHDVYLTTFKAVFKRTYESNPAILEAECTKYVKQLFGKYNTKFDTIMPEVEEAMKYKTLTDLYSQYKLEKDMGKKEKDSLMSLLIKQLILSNSVELQSSILNTMIGYQFPKTEFFRHLGNLFIIADKQCIEKYKQLSDLMPEMADCLNQLASWLNVSDIKTLKQSSFYLSKWKAMVIKLYFMFEECADIQEGQTEMCKIRKKDERFTNLFMRTKAYSLIINFLKLSAKMKIEAASNVLKGNERLGLHAVTFSLELLKVIELSNKLLALFCQGSSKAKHRMLKHIPRVVLIPPPGVEDKEQTWEAYANLTASDIELIDGITVGNGKIAYLNNQQVRYFKELVVALNEGICHYNIDKIFMIYENIFDQTTHEGLYDLILSLYWDNKKRINPEEILEITSDTPVEVINKHIQLMKATLLMAKNQKLSTAKNKLREMFCIEFLTQSFPKLKHIYLDKQNRSVLELLKLILENYGEMYLREKHENYTIQHKLQSFFIDQDTALHNEGVTNLGQLELIREVYQLYLLFTRWVRHYGSKLNQGRTGELFTQKLTKTINDLCERLDPQDELVEAVYRLFGNDKRFVDALPKRAPLKKDKLDNSEIVTNEIENIYTQFENIKSKIQKDASIQEELGAESDRFCRKLLHHIKQVKDPEKLLDRLFVGRLIEYISHSGDSSVVNIRTVKYLLRAFIKVIDMVSDSVGDEKERKKAEKLILRTLDSLKLTKILLGLLCSEESESLDSILPLLLKLANKMLTGPIKAIQDQFYEEFMRNRHAERLFERMYGVIDRNIFIYHHHFTRFAMNVVKEPNYLGCRIDLQAEILKFLKALCENHNTNLQLYMAEQTYSKNKYNMVAVTSNYLYLLVKEVKRMLNESPGSEKYAEEMRIRSCRMKTCYKHAILAMKALIEFVQGPCEKNQEEISNTPFFTLAEDVLSIDFLFMDILNKHRIELMDNYKISQLKKECAILMLSLMEQKKSNDPLIAKMRLKVTEKNLLYNLYYVYFAFTKQTDGSLTEALLFPDKKDRPEFLLEVGFTLLFVIKKWFEGKIEIESDLQEQLTKLTDQVINSEAETFFISSLTTFAKDLVLGFVYLCKKAVVSVEFTYKEFLRSKDEEQFRADALNFFNKFTGSIEIVRNNTTDLVYFPILPYAEALQSEQKMEWLQSLPVGKPRAKLDCFMANSLDYIQQLNNEYLFTKIFRYYPVFGALAKQIPLWRNFAFCLAIVINLVILFSYRKGSDGWDNRMKHPSLFDYFSVGGTETALNVLGGMMTLFSGIIVLSFLYKYALSTYYRIKLAWEHRREESSNSNGISKNLLMILEILWQIVSNGELLFNLAGLVLAFAGWFLHPFFFTFHLLNVAFRSKRLLNVLKAIIDSAAGILLTLLLYAVMEYVFAVVGYVLFPEDFGDYTCSNLLNCFLYNIDMTFKGDGGIGSTMEPPYKFNEEDQYAKVRYERVIFDFLFSIIMTMIIVQLLSGLIIDKFKSLRDETERIENDMRAACLICSESAEFIERKDGTTFNYHFDNVHNPWFYLMFIGYLLRKPKLDFSGIESYVYENFKRESIVWLPYSIWEKTTEKDDTDAIEDTLNDIHQRITKSKENAGILLEGESN